MAGLSAELPRGPIGTTEPRSEDRERKRERKNKKRKKKKLKRSYGIVFVTAGFHDLFAGC